VSKKQEAVVLDDCDEIVNLLDLRRRKLRGVREVVCRECGKVAREGEHGRGIRGRRGSYRGLPLNDCSVIFICSVSCYGMLMFESMLEYV
jgi:hypothetical protein